LPGRQKLSAGLSPTGIFHKARKIAGPPSSRSTTRRTVDRRRPHSAARSGCGRSTGSHARGRARARARNRRP
jgi:hypothetical protein